MPDGATRWTSSPTSGSQRAEKAALTRQLAECDTLQVLKPGKPDVAAQVGHGEIEPIKKV